MNPESNSVFSMISQSKSLFAMSSKSRGIFDIGMNSKNTVEIFEVPPAPLVRETLDKCNAYFKQKKQKLLPELPMLTPDQLVEEYRKEELSDDYVTARLMAMGYVKSANEINHLMRVDAFRLSNMCKDPPDVPLTKDKKSITYLARFFTQAEVDERRGDWKGSHLVRMRIAAYLFGKYPWLSKVVLQKSLSFLSLLDSQRSDHVILKANVYMMLAYVITCTKADYVKEAMEYLLKSEALSEEICMEEEDNQGRISIDYKGDSKFLKIVQVKIERPISIHGWRKSSGVQAFETVIASELSSFYAAVILHSWLYLQIVKSKAHHSHRFWHEHDELYLNEEEHNLTEEAFKQGMLLAYQGQNETSVLSLLCTYGKYLMRKSSYDEAKAIFTQMEEKARGCNDMESAGVAYNRLGKIYHRQWAITEAADNFFSQWELGIKYKHDVLVIDSLKSLGRIMLEEGHFHEAEISFRQAFDKYEEIKKVTAETIVPEEMHEDEDDLYDEAWCLSGISAGHSVWIKFVSLVTYARGKFAIDPILHWKSTRIPLPDVPEEHFKHRRIDKKPTPRQMSQSLAARLKCEHDTAYMREMNVKSPDDLIADWVANLEDETYEFQTDIDAKESGIQLEDLEFRYYRPGLYNEYSHSSDESNAEEEEEEEEYDEEEDLEDEDEEDVEEQEEEEQEQEVTEVIVADIPEEVIGEEEDGEEDEDEDEDEEEDEEDTDEFEDVLEFLGECDSRECVFSVLGEGEDYTRGPTPSLDMLEVEDANLLEAEQEET